MIYKVNSPKFVVRTISYRNGRRGIAPTKTYRYPAIRYYDEVTNEWRAASLRRILYGDLQVYREELL
jgi:hypothetical protein